MRIASITMVGQFPDGIDLHVRNLRWALTDQDHIYIVTSPKIIKTLTSYFGVTYIPFEGIADSTGFINFWKEFPSLIKEYNIDPEWFMFLEEDIWFFAKPIFGDDPKEIRAFLPLGDYRNVLMNDEFYHSRVWEGAQVIHGDIVRRAIDFGIDFSFVKETFLDKDKEKYEGISLSKYQVPDTMDEFTLYCALIEKTNVEHIVKALHLRGPESIHRLYPDVYHFATQERLDEIQRKFPYLDILLVVAIYYIVGVWEKVDHLDWTGALAISKREIDRLLITGNKWMKFQEYTRLDSLRLLMSGNKIKRSRL